MEFFHSMTYRDVMEMPYRDFTALLQIRVKRKQEEQKTMERERKKMEEKNEKDMIRNRMVKGKSGFGPRK